MRKKFALEDLCCANCAAKIEHAIQKLDGVNEASINFMAQKLTLDADDACFDDILGEVKKVITKIEPDCTLIC